jgi:hypothetical protein
MPASITSRVRLGWRGLGRAVRWLTGTAGMTFSRSRRWRASATVLREHPAREAISSSELRV